MSFMFHNDQYDDNWDQYKVDLKVENEKLKEDNQRAETSTPALYS